MNRPVTLAVVVAACFAAGFAARGVFVNAGPGEVVQIVEQHGGTRTVRTVHVFSVLLMGLDARPGQSYGRTDTMMVLSVNRDTGRIALLSVPRDTYVNIPGYGVEKINAADELGGPQLALQTVNRLLGSDIRYYMITNFQGFRDIINTLGGVEIDVPFPMHYIGGPNTHIDLNPGWQHLNGTQALEFVRFRDVPTGDIGRTLDQQLFLKAVIKQAYQFGTIFKLPALIPELSRAVITNLPVGDMIYLARQAPLLGGTHIVSETLPGYFWNTGQPPVSYWLVIPRDAHQAYVDLLQGIRRPLYDPQAVAFVRAHGSEPLTASPPPSPAPAPSAQTGVQAAGAGAGGVGGVLSSAPPVPTEGSGGQGSGGSASGSTPSTSGTAPVGGPATTTQGPAGAAVIVGATGSGQGTSPSGGGGSGLSLGAGTGSPSGSAVSGNGGGTPSSSGGSSGTGGAAPAAGTGVSGSSVPGSGTGSASAPSGSPSAGSGSSGSPSSPSPSSSSSSPASSPSAPAPSQGGSAPAGGAGVPASGGGNGTGP